MSFLLSIIVAFAIGFTGQSATVTEAPAPASQVQQITQHDPILAMDAAATLADHASQDYIDEKGNKFVPTYVGSDESSDSMFGEFTFESIDFPGTFHHYTYERLLNT
jgi:hypothetical protein